MNRISDFKRLLKESTKIHAHVCAGQVLGVRMSMLGLGKIGITDPKGKDRKKLMVFVEVDKCATDAIQWVTGCTLGKRTLKFMNYGKMAATFLNLHTGKAVRILARDSMEKACEYFPAVSDKYQAQMQAYKIMPDEELFLMQDVIVNVGPGDLPRMPRKKTECSACRESVHDINQESVDGLHICRSCIEGTYYSPV